DRHATLRGHDSYVLGVAFSPDGQFLLSTEVDGSTRLWNPWTRQGLVRFPGTTYHISRDGRRLASRSGQTLTVREVNTGRECRVLPHRTGATRTNIGEWDISPDGRWLAASGSLMRFWDLARGEEVGPPTGPACAGIRFHPGGRELFTSGRDGVYRWAFEADAGAVRVRPTERLLPPSACLGLAGDGSRLAVAGASTVSGLDLKERTAPVIRMDHDRALAAAVSPDGRWAATTTRSGLGVRVWDARTGRLVETLVPDARHTQAAFAPDGRWLVTSAGEEFAVWEVGTWRPVVTTPPDNPGVIARPIASSPDGAVLALAVSPA